MAAAFHSDEKNKIKRKTLCVLKKEEITGCYSLCVVVVKEQARQHGRGLLFRCL